MNAKLRADDGFLLIEVLISAALLLMVSAAVFLTLQNSDSLAGNQQRRTIAANVAQGELERLRAQPINEVAKLVTAKTVEREHAGITYTVQLKSKWLADGSDEDSPTCTSRNGGLDYLRATATVSWEGMKNAKPQTITTLVTPRGGAGDDDHGSLSVRIVDRDGTKGQPGITVSLTRPGRTYTETTNVNGCVLFPFVPVANDYSVQFNRLGMVDINGDQAVTEAVSVAPNATSKVELMYDVGGTTAFSFRTWRAGQTGPPTIPTRPAKVSLFAAQQPQATVLGLGTADAWDDRNRKFFPFTTQYTIYAGGCEKSVPHISQGVNIVPAQHRPVSGAIVVPSLDLEVWSDGSRDWWGRVTEGSMVSNAKVTVSNACGEEHIRTTGVASFGTAAPSLGRMADPGFPYARDAEVCASARVDGTNRKWVGTRDITNMSGGAPLEKVYLRGTGSSSGTC